ncbi:NAD-dependent epimerase/dehydratase family protein [Neorhizobium alkalisoli]|uniref:UDP-glucose 4-epimerase/UDP-glucuronate 4-epimerase n=1 Tax=Neorhizobium alkalisoli TaxID=528178 RepID=A0A561QGC6_9HYPH|nr:NAD(P)-dependent oxidoreductase [Neorhizobium alkalisoli]TWF49428.1 UDP-glucose 4-epimerase/UDP-glucuronate 4-epimerase [Neorhizobium alkalisoli]
MRILITGGTGFVGLATAETLLAAGHEVTLFATSPLPDAFRDAKALAGAKIALGDICSEADLGAVIAQARPEAVLHLAAMTPDIEAEREMAARIIAVNVGGTATLLKMLRNAPDLKRVVTTSSVAVYGHVDLADGPIAEERAPNPASLYGITKAAAENTAQRLASLYGFDLRIARLGPLFGPWEYHTGVRPLLSPHAQVLAQWRKGSAAALARPLLGDWLYSRDAAQGLADLLTGTELRHAVYNIGAGASETVLDWANGFSGSVGGHGATVATSDEAPNVTVTMAQDRASLSIDRLSQDTGYTPKYRGETAAADYAEWLTTFDPLPKRISA